MSKSYIRHMSFILNKKIFTALVLSFMFLFSNAQNTVGIFADINWPAWSGENCFYIISPGGTTIGCFCDPNNCYNAANGSYGASMRYLGELPVECGQYTIRRYEQFGDGWNNGGTVNIYADGVYVGTYGNTCTSAGCFQDSQVQLFPSGCNIAAEGNTSPAPVLPSGCLDGTARMGSGAYRDIALTANTYYNFSWNNNGAPNISGFCATVTGSTGATSTTFNTNQTNWYSGTTASTIRISANRSNCVWNGTSGILTYRHSSPANATSTASPSSICLGSSATITAGGGTNGVLYYQATTSGGTSTTVTINPQTVTPGSAGTFNYYWRAGNNGCWGNEGVSSVSVSPVTVAGTASSGSSSVCINGTTALSLAGFTGTVTRWEVSFNGGSYSNIASSANANITSPALTSVGTYTFRALVQSGACSAIYSTTVNVTVVAATVGGSAAPSVGTFCAGGNTTISLSGNTGNVINWEVNINSAGWNAVPSSSLITTLPTGTLNTPGTYQYRANVQNSPCAAQLSTVATITVDPLSVGGTAASTGTLICNGDNPTISLTGNTGVVINWERQVNGGGFNNIGNAGLTSFSAGALAPGIYDYRAVVKSGTCANATSNSVTVTVSNFSVGGSAVPQVSTLCQGGSTNINLSGQTGSILYWEQQIDGGGWSNIGNTGLTVIASGALNIPGYNEFRAVIQNGGCPAVNSTPAGITVNPTSVGGSLVANFNTVCEGASVSLILSGNTGSIVNWERQLNGGGFSNIGNGGNNLLTTPALSPSGTYEYRVVVQSGICPSTVSSTETITVNPYDDATFNYSSSVYCQGGTNPSPSVAQGGGTFTSSPAGLSIDPSTGIVNLTASTAGSYSITYTTAGVCPSTYSQSITVVGTGDASFSYSSLNYCTTGANPTPTVTTSGGTFTSVPAGLIFTNTSTGQVNLAASAVGSYAVTYTLPGTCPSSQTQTVNIGAPGNTAFGYDNIQYCLAGPNNPSPTIAQFGGTFSSSPLGIVFTNNQTGTIDLMNSIPGVYNVTYSLGGNCPGSTSHTVILNEAGDPLFFYASSSYCQNATNPVPFISSAGGSFTSSPAGLLFVSPVTGEISLSTSVPGGYVVTYNTGGLCPQTYSQNILISPTQNAAFNYSQGSYCQFDTDPTPNVAQIGGTFTSFPAGLVFANQFTGKIDVSASSAGTYTVTYTVPGACIGTYTQQVIINAGITASLSYPASIYCSNDADPSATVSPTGGTFTSSPLGLSINPAGTIDLSASVPGNYTVTYSPGTSCQQVATQSILINSSPNATFNYSQSAYCQFDADPSANVASIGGTFTASPAGLVFNNASTGSVDLSASSAGTYTVTYTIPGAGSCSGVYTQSLTVNAGTTATLSYPASTFCSNGTDPIATVTPSGGTFTSAPLGLSINPTGAIDLSASVPGNYTVTYSPGIACQQTASQSILINASPNATFNYSQSAYCQFDADPSANVASIGGTFTASPAGLVFNNASTGSVDLSASTAGTYTVTYTVPGAGSCSGVYTQSLTVNASVSASLSYPASSFCTNGTDPAATVAPAGGTFTSSPLGLSINGAGTIDVSATVPGAYAVNYTAPGLCGTTTTANVIVINAPQAFIQPTSTLCTGSPSVILTASPSGGTFSGGAYVNASGVFNPAVAGAGTHTVNYTVSGSGGCNASASYNVVVNASPSVSITPAGPFCSNDSIQVLTASPLGGTWSGNPFVSINGLFFPAEAGAGVYPVMYTVTNGGCTGSAVASVQVLYSPIPTINPVASICASGAPIGLSSNVSGGTWSGGPYVSASGTFTPALASVGNNLVTYTVTNGSCTAQSSAQIAVNGNPNVNIITPSPFCQDGSPAFINVNLPGGTFNGGAYINGAGLFNPALASVGNNTVIYTMTASNGCVGSDTVNVLVNSNPNATITDPGLVCENDPAFALQTATGGGTFGGGPYVNNGIFNPAVAGSGSHPVTYSVSSAGCSSSSSIFVNVSPMPIPLFNYQPNGLFSYFTDLSQNADSWSWNFGDGSAEVTTQNPTHLYPDNGTYQTRLIVGNQCGADTIIRSVLVNKNVGISENSGTTNINLFPNPADQYIQITATLQGDGEWALEMVDVTGKTVMIETAYPTAGELNKTIDVSTLKPGVYFINIRSKGVVHTVKFVKM